ncbi:MAG: monovalent cation/H+ antiporter subunit D family protein, partial [Marinosulfonomonas sp.]|nr:monovalent cation/H+ antiporter subunit D family protein [Marinosulfonomonas sp.]
MSADPTHVARTLTDHMPILVVLVPLLAAPLVVLIGSRRLAWWIAFAACLASFLISCVLLANIFILNSFDIGVISYHIGGWAPPMGIEYRIDAANAFVLLLVTAIGTIVLPYARESIKSEIDERHHTLFYTAYLLCFTGLLGVVATGDAFNVFVFLEISSLSTYVLVAMGAKRDKRALTAAYDYLIMGTIGATFFVIGIGFLYAGTGTLNMAGIAAHISAHGADRTIQTAFAFIVVGMGLKVAIYPLHLWLPNAYTYAPSAVSVFLGGTATKVAIYVLLRFMFSVFKPEFLFEMNVVRGIMMPLALVAMFAASLIAVFQTDFKRMLAYSS